MNISKRTLVSAKGLAKRLLCSIMENIDKNKRITNGKNKLQLRKKS